MQNHCDLWYEINDEHRKRWNPGSINNPPGYFTNTCLLQKLSGAITSSSFRVTIRVPRVLGKFTLSMLSWQPFATCLGLKTDRKGHNRFAVGALLVDAKIMMRNVLSKRCLARSLLASAGWSARMEKPGRTRITIFILSPNVQVWKRFAVTSFQHRQRFKKHVSMQAVCLMALLSLSECNIQV